MKAILMSVRPEWVRKIEHGQKTIEVRKTRPKLEPPFKCYIYMTLARPYCFEFAGDGMMKAKNGKVIGEFVCDRAERLRYPEDGFADVIDLKMSCLSAEEIIKYSDGTPLYGWHISELKIYDKPKELGEFSSALSSGLSLLQTAVNAETGQSIGRADLY